jgi:hypothetical protein
VKVNVKGTAQRQTDSSRQKLVVVVVEPTFPPSNHPTDRVHHG